MLWKRTMDVLGASVGLVLLSPVLLVLAVLVRTRLGPPVLFTQRRPGLDGQPFTLHKFRTMTEERDAEGHLLPDEQRLTRFGQWLRTTSLDELPELYDVLRGRMSLVGPRPLLTAYLEHYDERQASRHDVKPGMTGWAQVQGRNELDWDARLEADAWYVEHVSLWLDARILARTVVTVVRREGISSPGHVTGERFDA